MAPSFAPLSTSKITRSSISSPLSSGASTISGVTPRLRSSRISFRSSGIGRSSLVSSQSSVETTLTETNQILVEIQQQIAIAFGMRNAEEKEKNKNLKEERTRRRLRLREGALESVKKIGGAIKKTAKFVASPFKSFFDKILEFISLLGLGIGANAVFGWFQKEENRKKLEKFFNIITSNWKLIRNILGVIAGLVIGAKIIAFGTALAGLAAPLAALAAAAGLILGTAAPTSDSDQITGENAVFNDDSLGDDDFKIEEVPILSSIFRVNSQENRERRARQTITLIEPIVRGKEFEDWAPDQQKKYDNAINFLKLDKDKMLDRLNTPGTGPLPLLPENLDGFRAMGGPVTAGNTYLVGERGPEIFSPNIDGSIVNNMRTEKIYEMISSKNAGKINFVSMELPPKFINSKKNTSTREQQEIPIPTISAVNGSNPYMSITPNVYGIYV